MTGKILASMSIVAMILLVILLNSTSPSNAGPIGIIVIFTLLYLSVLGILTFLLFGLSFAVQQVSQVVTVRKPLRRLSLIRAYYYSSILALLPIMLLGMQSVGTAGVYEVLLVSIFGILGTLYVAKRGT